MVCSNAVCANSDDRLLFACDGSMERGLGKILDAGLTEAQRAKLYSANFLNLLARRKR